MSHPENGGGRPVRVQLRRTKGWKMPPNTAKVDRTTKCGNPFIVERMSGRELWDAENQRWIRGLYSVRRLGGPWFYEAYIRSKQQATSRAVEMYRLEIAGTLNLERLRGKNLACWCKPGEPCHADVLLELANPPEPTLAEKIAGAE